MILLSLLDSSFFDEIVDAMPPNRLVTKYIKGSAEIGPCPPRSRPAKSRGSNNSKIKRASSEQWSEDALELSSPAMTIRHALPVAYILSERFHSFGAFQLDSSSRSSNSARDEITMSGR